MAHGQWSGGKGSAQRKVDKKKYSDNWDAIFSKKSDTDLKFTTAEDFINSTLDNEGVLDGSCKEEDEEET
jgi:hypothetical protein